MSRPRRLKLESRRTTRCRMGRDQALPVNAPSIYPRSTSRETWDTEHIRLSSCLGHDLVRTLNISSHLPGHAQGFPRDLDSLQRFEFAKLVPYRKSQVKSKQPRSVGALPHEGALSKNNHKRSRWRALPPPDPRSAHWNCNCPPSPGHTVVLKRPISNGSLLE